MDFDEKLFRVYSMYVLYQFDYGILTFVRDVGRIILFLFQSI